MSRPLAALLVCLLGAVLSLTFTSNFGWVFFDLCDHYISSYVILGAALSQCVSVGWVFERESTAKMSDDHRKSLRWLAIVYWFPVIIVSFYSHFGFPDNFEIGIIIIFVTSCLSLLVSYMVAKGENFKAENIENEKYLMFLVQQDKAQSAEKKLDDFINFTGFHLGRGY